MLNLDHPNVVELKEYFVWHGRLCLVMELLHGESLLSLFLIVTYLLSRSWLGTRGIGVSEETQTP